MTNLIDILSRFRAKLTDARVSSETLISNWTQFPDDLLELLDDYATNAEGKLSKTVDRIKMSEYADHLKKLEHQTYTLASGTLVTLESQVDEATGLYKGLKNADTGEMVLEFIDNGTDQLEVRYHGLAGEFADENFSSLLDSVIEADQVSTIVDSAISLSLKGELTAANLNATCGTIVNQGPSAATEAYDAIVASASGTTAQIQATSLIAALRSIYSGWNGATPEGEGKKIGFNTTDFSVNTSLAFPVQALVSAATTVLSVVTAIINPIFGATVAVVGSAVAKAVEYVRSNQSDKPKFHSSSERDNDCFCQPFMQCTALLDQLPASLADTVRQRGFVKASTGLCTIYMWLDPQEPNTKVQYEGYLSARLWQSFSSSDPLAENLISQHIASAVGDNGSLNFYLADLTSTGNFAYLMENTTYGYTTGATYEDIGASKGIKRQWYEASVRLRDTVALAAYLSLLAYHGTSFTWTYTSSYDWRVEPSTWSVRTATEKLADYLYWFNTLRETDDTGIYDDNMANLWAGVTNVVMPAMIYLNADSNSKHPGWIFNIFRSWSGEIPSDSPNSVKGAGIYPYISYDAINGVNGYVYPPNSAISPWVYVALGTVAVAVVALSTAILAVKIKATIRTKAFAKRQELSKLVAKASASGSPEDYDKAWKATKRYNKFWGKLSGTSYDVTNGWTNSLATSSVPEAASSRIPDAIETLTSAGQQQEVTLQSVQDLMTTSASDLKAALQAIEKLIAG